MDELREEALETMSSGSDEGWPAWRRIWSRRVIELIEYALTLEDEMSRREVRRRVANYQDTLERRATPTETDPSVIECSCCGGEAARGFVTDGQALACGCDGQISLDAETEPWANAGDCDCGGDGRPTETDREKVMEAVLRDVVATLAADDVIDDDITRLYRAAREALAGRATSDPGGAACGDLGEDGVGPCPLNCKENP